MEAPTSRNSWPDEQGEETHVESYKNFNTNLEIISY